MVDQPNIPNTFRNRILRLFANPWIGVSTTICAFVGIALSIYLAQPSVPKLSYLVDHTRVSVVTQGTASRLGVLLDGKPLTNNVSAVRLALWNRGEAPVAKEDVRAPIRIRTEPTTPIIEVKVIKTSNDVVQFSLDQSQLSDGIATVSWNMLETGDGALIQVIYAGDTTVDVKLDGAMKGQREMSEIADPTRDVKSLTLPHWAMKWLVILNLILLIAMVGQNVYRLMYWPPHRREPRKWIYYVNCVMAVVMFASIMWAMNAWLWFSPPPIFP